MTKTITQFVDDWFKNSPDWPSGNIDLDSELDAMLADECPWSQAELDEAIESFAEDNGITII